HLWHGHDVVHSLTVYAAASRTVRWAAVLTVDGQRTFVASVAVPLVVGGRAANALRRKRIAKAHGLTRKRTGVRVAAVQAALRVALHELAGACGTVARRARGGERAAAAGFRSGRGGEIVAVAVGKPADAGAPAGHPGAGSARLT